MKKKTIKIKSQKLQKDDDIKIREILKEIEHDPKAFDFIEPVDFVGLGLDDYLTVILKPMDFYTIKVKIYFLKKEKIK